MRKTDIHRQAESPGDLGASDQRRNNDDREEQDEHQQFHWDNAGYATFSMTTRGFGQSCGVAASRTSARILRSRVRSISVKRVGDDWLVIARRSG